MGKKKIDNDINSPGSTTSEGGATTSGRPEIQTSPDGVDAHYAVPKVLLISQMIRNIIFIIATGILLESSGSILFLINPQCLIISLMFTSRCFFFIQPPVPFRGIGVENIDSGIRSVRPPSSGYAIMSGRSPWIPIKQGLETPNSESGIEGPHQQSSEQDSVASLDNDAAKDFRARLDLVVTNKQVRINPVHIIHNIASDCVVKGSAR